MSLRVEQASLKSPFVTLHGRGDLHLGVLIEKMRREGFELAIKPPTFIFKDDPTDPKKKLEPYEEVVIDADLDYVSGIIDKLNDRKGILLNCEEQKDGR